MSIFSPNRSDIELAINKERLRFTENQLRITEEQSKQFYQALEETRNDRDHWKLQFEVTAKDLKYAQELLENEKQMRTSKRKIAYWLAGVTNSIFLIESILMNIGTSLLFSSPLHPALAYVTLGISSALSIIGAIVTVIMAKGE